MNVLFSTVAVLSLVWGSAGCAKKSGEAVVVAKEHIEKKAESSPAESAARADPNELREMTDDEIAVDGYVMKRDVRGTSKDPRAMSSEQWRVKVQMIENGREFNVQTEQKRWDKLKNGDRVKVKYSQGNYTGTIWGGELEDDG